MGVADQTYSDDELGNRLENGTEDEVCRAGPCGKSQSSGKTKLDYLVRSVCEALHSCLYSLLQGFALNIPI